MMMQRLAIWILKSDVRYALALAAGNIIGAAIGLFIVWLFGGFE